MVLFKACGILFCALAAGEISKLSAVGNVVIIGDNGNLLRAYNVILTSVDNVYKLFFGKVSKLFKVDCEVALAHCSNINGVGEHLFN